MTEMFGEAWSPMSVPDLAPDDDDDTGIIFNCVSIMIELVHMCKKLPIKISDS